MFHLDLLFSHLTLKDQHGDFRHQWLKCFCVYKVESRRHNLLYSGGQRQLMVQTSNVKVQNPPKSESFHIFYIFIIYIFNVRAAGMWKDHWGLLWVLLHSKEEKHQHKQQEKSQTNEFFPAATVNKCQWKRCQIISVVEFKLTSNIQSGSSTKSPPQWYKVIEAPYKNLRVERHDSLMDQTEVKLRGLKMQLYHQAGNPHSSSHWIF